MGGNCSCVSKDDPANVEIPVQGQKEPKETQASAPVEPIEALPKWSTADVLTIQGAIRNFLVLRQQRSVLSTVLVMEQVQEEPGVEEAGSQVVIQEVPDLLSKEAKEKLGKLPPFVYQLLVSAGDAKGPVQLSDGSVYVGQWLNNKRFGKGKFYSKDGGYFEGYWNGGLHLQGRIIFPNGDHYEGGLKHHKKDGKGIFQDLAGTSSYDGEWKDDLKHGSGVEHLPDGSVYNGAFENDMKTGFGVFKWVKGEVFEGHFKDNMMHGKGKYMWSETRWYDGDWEQGKMQGQGTYVQEGKEYVGDFVQDKKHGKAVYKWEGNVYEGEFKDGKMHGKGYLAMKGKERKLYAFENNKRGAVIEEPAGPSPGTN